MTRQNTQCSHQAVSIKQRHSTPKICRFTYVLVYSAIIGIAYFFISGPGDSLGDPSDQFVVKTIPKFYTQLEGEGSDEKDVFEGFCTSFLPPEDHFLGEGHLRDRREVYEDNVTSDIPTWARSEKQRTTINRMSGITLMGNQKQRSRRSRRHDHSGDYGLEENSEAIEYESLSSGEIDYDDDQDEDLQRAMHPEPHVDRGPLEDVVEQVRGQPELEEEEMMASAHVYKHGQPIKEIHAFWKGQGDKETIRETQAKIMKQYMDAEADPCHDFYQYACGNWPALNPIPADKAGYDTFEMLRENLDTVLKDLLEFKHHESVPSTYPGDHLELDENILLSLSPKPPPENYDHDDDDRSLSRKPILENYDNDGDNLDLETLEHDALKIFKGTRTLNINHTTIKIHKEDKSKVIDRIRRYLDSKIKRINNLKTRATKLFHHDMRYRNIATQIKKMNLQRIKRSAKNYVGQYKTKQESEFVKKTETIQTGRKLLMYRRNKHNMVAKISRKPQRRKKKRQTMELEEPNPQNVFDFPEDPDDDPAHGDAATKARYLYKSCMNYEILRKRGHQPILDLLQLLGGWPILDTKWNADKFDWLELMAKLRLYNNDILISEWVGPDIKNSDEFVIQFDQTSLGLPTRDYFLQDSNKIYLMAYKDYLLKVAILLGGKPSHVRASVHKLINFEIKLAKITSGSEDRRNVSELYRRMPLYKLEALVPEIKWRRYLCVVMNRNVHPNETVVMFALSYVRHLVELIRETDPSVLSNYMLWRFVRHRVNNLDDRFQSAKQQFYFVLFGREQAPPRWKNCISQVNSNMGMALGSMFVRNYFDETSKNDTLAMTIGIQKSFKELLHKTDWIDNKTKKLAAHKVNAMMLRIGYPDFILNKHELDERYKEVKIHPDKYFENILNILKHLTKMEQERIGEPVNKTLWNTAPAVVNAYYSRNKNQIMFPAGILQPPFYHRHFPRSLNYGGIGVVIGHEITHGFDDKGRLFDSDGNLHRWWSDSAIENFHRRAQCLIDQYGHYVVPEVNVKLDGVNTQGENIADNGGVKQAFRAYLHWVQHHGTAGETLPGLNYTHTQLFFLNFAQVWCGAMRPEAMRNKLKTAVHSPGRFRVIGTLSNSHDFAREFRCPPGSPMNPREKCSVW